MGRDQGRMGRAFARFFRERQIYHRADGVVRFIKLSSRTQLALATFLGLSIMWVAYASVNVVFKEQIIVSKDQQRRDQEAAFRSRIQNAETAYDQVNVLNYYYAREFDATITSLKGQHDALRALVENKTNVDAQFDALADTLSETGPPGSNRKDNANRLMVDPVGREPTPRQSRISALRDEALKSIMEIQVATNIEDEVLEEMRQETAELSARQVVLMASLEEDMRQRIIEAKRILQHTGMDTTRFVSHHHTKTLASLEQDDTSAQFANQGGPFLPVANTAGSLSYYKSVSRLNTILTELTSLKAALENAPIGTPMMKKYRLTSGFGLRVDPIKKNVVTMHRGLDFGGPMNTPIHTTAPGRVTFTGRKGGYGLIVEVDHGNGFLTKYAHLNKIKVRRGQKLDLYDTVGLLGNTGRSTGPHLHYEVVYRGRQLDPIKFMEAGRYVFES
ncbi:MAG: peptidoglycan DD-metalloendopeptidase family protein [Pseudomonadota bacterium]